MKKQAFNNFLCVIGFRVRFGRLYAQSNRDRRSH